MNFAWALMTARTQKKTGQPVPFCLSLSLYAPTLNQEIGVARRMATGAEAVQRIAKATAIGQHAVFRAARALREAEADLWPKGAPGGGKGAAHVYPHHLVNRAVALVISQTHAEAPQTVVTYRGLRPWFDQDDRNSLPFNRDTFGEELDYIVERIEDFGPDDRPHEPNRLAAAMLSREALEVVLAYRGQPFALTIIHQGLQEATGFWTMPSPEQNVPEAAPLRSGKIPFALFKVWQNCGPTPAIAREPRPSLLLAQRLPTPQRKRKRRPARGGASPATRKRSRWFERPLAPYLRTERETT